MIVWLLVGLGVLFAVVFAVYLWALSETVDGDLDPYQSKPG